MNHRALMPEIGNRRVKELWYLHSLAPLGKSMKLTNTDQPFFET